MTLADTEHVKPRGLYVEEAIAAALEVVGRDAVAVNEALIERHGADEETYNRLGKAKSELGDLEEALARVPVSLDSTRSTSSPRSRCAASAALLEARARPAAAAG